MLSLTGLIFFLASFPSGQKSALEDVVFNPTFSSASTKNKAIAWTNHSVYPTKKFALIYDFESNTFIEVPDDQLKLALFSTVITCDETFFIVDNTSGKYGHFDFNGQHLDHGSIRNWQGYSDLAATWRLLVSPYKDGISVATYDKQAGGRGYALIDFRNKQIKKMGTLPVSKDKDQYVIGSQGKNYLVEPSLGNISLFDLEENQKIQTIYEDPNGPAYFMTGEDQKMRHKCWTHLTFNGALSLQFNNFFDETGAPRQNQRGFVANHYIIDGPTIKPTNILVVGADTDNKQLLVYDPQDRKLHLKNHAEL